jgi:uncharacterized Ntn-hydrolase superfamily protein
VRGGHASRRAAYASIAAMRRGTYSIVARDAASGELGVAVQSHWFAVGSLVGWLRPGVGAAATQSIVEVAHGPEALARLEQGLAPQDALDGILASDQLAGVRQVGVVDSQGRAAAHTGAGCIAHAGQVCGAGFSCQANMMLADTVPAAMAHAYETCDGALADRLLAALVAAEAQGGDVRGRQSAALVVAPAQGEPWRRRFDVRVDDHEDPLGELARLLALARAYEAADRADGLLAAGERVQATRLYEESAALAPGADELRFWAGLGVAAEDLERGVALVAEAARADPAWLTLLERLPDDLAPAAASVRAALGRG